MRLLLAGFSFLLGAGMMSAEGFHFASGPEQTALLELFTSEGCSSCPPAEARLNQLKESTGLWKQFVPVSYHVDYWDRLGWRDRFSSPQWTERQNRYAALWRSESVYTPAFVLNGREVGGLPANLASPNEQRTGHLSAVSADGNRWKIEFHPTADSAGDWEAHVALLGSGLSSKIAAGENSGRNLEHEFVVLNLQDILLQKGGASLTIPPPPDNISRKAVAVWVTRRGELAPLQATGGWLAPR
jgi:hypothetical protein